MMSLFDMLIKELKNGTKVEDIQNMIHDAEAVIAKEKNERKDNLRVTAAAVMADYMNEVLGKENVKADILDKALEELEDSIFFTFGDLKDRKSESMTLEEFLKKNRLLV